MHRQLRINDSAHLFMSDLTARIIAETGIPSDRYHLGKIILQSLKDAPDFINQIDGSTGAEESNKSVLERSVRCAQALRKAGLKQGDVVVLMAPNHLDLAIPFYAALYLGIIIAPLDINLTVHELVETLKVDEPKMIFCQSNKVDDTLKALSTLNSKCKVVTFDMCENINENVLNFSTLMENHTDNACDKNFKATDFDPNETIAFVIPTSGTTGLPKQAAMTHKNMVITTPTNWSMSWEFPTPTRLCLLTSHLQWISGVFQFYMSPIMRYTRVQASQPLTTEHLVEIINMYRPTYFIGSPSLMMSLINHNGSEHCDWSSMEIIIVGGSKVTDQVLEDLKKVAPKAHVVVGYGATELATFYVFYPDSTQSNGALIGKRGGLFNHRLVDSETGQDINEPDTPGELWVKGPSVFKGYFKNPEATAEAVTEDGWFKTGDMFYRDKNWNFYFVDRIKMLLKYCNHQISPAELESVITGHPGVLEAGVVGVPAGARGELPAAAVVPRPGTDITQQDIINLVKESLTETKQLRGGVYFLEMKQMPMTPSNKINRKKLKELVLQMRNSDV